MGESKWIFAGTLIRENTVAALTEDMVWEWIVSSHGSLLKITSAPSVSILVILIIANLRFTLSM